MTLSKLTGKVIRRQGQFLAVECSDAPEHLRWHNLTPFESGKAKVGDTVELEYRQTRSYGLWFVNRVLESTK